MKIIYLGPSESVNVAPYGPHRKDEVKEYPDDFGEELLATSHKQQFEAVTVNVPLEEPLNGMTIVEAIGRLDPDNADHWTNSGKPQVAATEEVLGKQISAADRDMAWEEFQKLQAGGN